MKRYGFFTILASLLLIPLSVYSYPVTATILDTGDSAFWGGEVTGPQAGTYRNRDVIGDGFSVDKMDIIKVDNNDWIVTLTGAYFTNTANSQHLAYTYGPGDLYIDSLGWNATQNTAGDHYVDDIFSQNEGWNYVVTNGAKGWGLYTLSADAAHGYQDTYSPTGYTYRDQQAWKGGANQFIGAATYDLSGNALTFAFNTGNLNWTDSVGFHWAMKCGNDVVEGMITAPAPPQVPEPGTLVLLGLGLAGVAGYKKIRS